MKNYFLKALFFASSLLITVSELVGQSIEITQKFSEPIVTSFGLKSLMGYGDNQIATIIKEKKVGVRLDVYDKELTVVKSTIFPNANTYSEYKIVELNTTTYVFAQNQNWKKKDFLNSISYSSIGSPSEFIPVVEFVSKLAIYADMSIKVSKRKNYFAMFIPLKETLEIMVFDSLMNKVSAHSLNLVARGINEDNIIVGNDGSVFYNVAVSPAKGFADANYAIFIPADTSKVEAIEITCKKNDVLNYTAYPLENGNWLIAGLYAENGSTTPNGAFTSFITSKGEYYVSKTYPTKFKMISIPEDRNKMQEKNFRMTAFLPNKLDDGTLTFSFEQFVYDIAYNFYDLLTIFVNESGEILTVQQSVKKQDFYGVNKGSSIIIPKENKLYVLFYDHNDNIENYNKEDLKRAHLAAGEKEFKHFKLVVETYGVGVKFERKVVEVPENIKLYISDFTPISSTEFIEESNMGRNRGISLTRINIK